MSANFVARELNYHMTQGWGEGDIATQEFFRSEETFAGRFSEMLAEVKALGFSAIDLWTSHLNPEWATAHHIDTAAALLAEHELQVTSLATYILNDDRWMKNLALIAQGVGAKIIGGGCVPALLAEERKRFVALLEDHDLIFGLENHPEKSSAEILEKIGDPEGGRIGATIDTGWFGTYGVAAVPIVHDLKHRLVHVHLKDIVAPEITTAHHDVRISGDENPTLKAMGHETCVLGDGVVGIEQVVEALRSIDYRGGISIEHEPEDRNPLGDVRLAYQRLQSWLEK